MESLLEGLNEWFLHLKKGIVLCLVGHVITWSWLVILTILIMKGK